MKHYIKTQLLFAIHWLNTRLLNQICRLSSKSSRVQSTTPLLSIQKISLRSPLLPPPPPPESQQNPLDCLQGIAKGNCFGPKSNIESRILSDSTKGTSRVEFTFGGEVLKGLSNRGFHWRGLRTVVNPPFLARTIPECDYLDGKTSSELGTV